MAVAHCLILCLTCQQQHYRKDEQTGHVFEQDFFENFQNTECVVVDTVGFHGCNLNGHAGLSKTSKYKRTPGREAPRMAPRPGDEADGNQQRRRICLLNLLKLFVFFRGGKPAPQRVIQFPGRPTASDVDSSVMHILRDAYSQSQVLDTGAV